MRKQNTLNIFLAPLWTMVQTLLRGMHYWIAFLFVLYLFSNVQTIKPDEVALVFRFGRLVGAGTPQAERPPGFLFAFPSPIDRVERIPAKKVYEIEIDELSLAARKEKRSFLASKSLDPDEIGYILTGDHNVLHLSLIARYQITSAERFSLRVEDPESTLHQLTLSAVLHESGARTVDELLTDGRQDWISDIQKRLQARCAQNELGIDIVSLEVVKLVPPVQVRDDFQAVQSASIQAQTSKQEAQSYRAEQLPRAQAARDQKISKARATAAKLLSKAKGDAQAFDLLVEESRKDDELLRTRLYREGVEEIFNDVGELRFLPAPLNERYRSDFRITIQDTP